MRAVHAASCAMALPVVSALAQGVAHTSRIVGVVGDSVNLGPLRGAEVVVTGFPATVVTDSLGRFTIDSLAPGTYQVGVFHPLLESLGVTLATKPFVIGPDSAGIVSLSVPSVPTLVRQYCGSKQTAAAPSSIAGLVLDPDTDLPVAGARVSLAWTEITVTKEAGVVRNRHELKTETNSSGFFKLCSLPSDLGGTLQATWRFASTPEVPVAMGGSLLAFQTLSISPEPDSRAGIVMGRVVTEAGTPLADVRVEIPVSGVSTVTSEDGTFRLNGVLKGTQVLVARRLGFITSADPVNVTLRAPSDIVVTLAQQGRTLDPVLITARRDVALEKSGFNARKRNRNGHFFTREDIERRKPHNISDMLQNLSGVTVSYQRGGVVISGRSGTMSTCSRLFVDGFEWRDIRAGDIDMVLNPDDLIGLEIYQPYDTPAHFKGFDRGCVTLVAWRQARTEAKEQR